MVIIGDISGIQSFLFDVAEEGGGQAQRLRARSLLIQLAALTAALRFLRALGWPVNESHFPSSAAGKFILEGPDQDNVVERLAAEREAMRQWLLRETRGELRLALGRAVGSGVEAYRRARSELQRAKARPWVPDGTWRPDTLMLEPLGVPPFDIPCQLCRHAPAQQEEVDREGKKRLVCRLCYKTGDIGRKLPTARRLIVRDETQGADMEPFGLGVTVSSSTREALDSAVAVIDLEDSNLKREGRSRDGFLKRRLKAYVPHDRDGAPTWFVDIAKKSHGDHLLGVLKADADSLGKSVEELLDANSDLRPYIEFSDRLDAFFAGRLRAEIESRRDPRWQWIYTIFAGGDDLIMVGPWDVMIDFAGRVSEWFRAEFGGRGLTISAAVALCKPKRPIKGVAAEAERLLERAKTEPKDNAKDQLACFGQVWKWSDHTKIVDAARRLVGWVQSERPQMERGWLHTLLGLVEARHPALFGPAGKERRPEYLATARLAHHVDRNYRQPEARGWADRLIREFDDPNNLEIRYLPAVLRYALTATRAPGEED